VSAASHALVSETTLSRSNDSESLILGLIVLAFYQYGQNQKQAKAINDRINEIVKLQEDATGELKAQQAMLDFQGRRNHQRMTGAR
jgi:hypothetical protein